MRRKKEKKFVRKSLVGCVEITYIFLTKLKMGITKDVWRATIIVGNNSLN